MNGEYLTFKLPELEALRTEMFLRSRDLLDKITEEKSPIKKGDVCEFCFYGNCVKVQITRVQLFAISLSGDPGHEYHFKYQGHPLNKKGEMIKGRKELSSMGLVRFNGVEYVIPSYLEVPVAPANVRGRDYLRF